MGDPLAVNLVKKANDSLGKPSAIDQTDLSRGTAKRAKPIEEEEDFKRMFKDLDYSKLSDMDQAYIRHFYTSEMQKLEDMRHGTYKPKPIKVPVFKKPRKQAKTQTIVIKVPAKKKAVPAPVEAPQVKPPASKEAQPSQASPLQSAANTESAAKGSEAPAKGAFRRIWRAIRNSKFIILGLILLFVMSRYAFSMRKLKSQKEKNIMFQNVGYEYEQFNKQTGGRGSKRKVLQI